MSLRIPPSPTKLRCGLFHGPIRIQGYPCCPVSRASNGLSFTRRILHTLRRLQLAGLGSWRPHTRVIGLRYSRVVYSAQHVKHFAYVFRYMLGDFPNRLGTPRSSRCGLADRDGSGNKYSKKLLLPHALGRSTWRSPHEYLLCLFIGLGRQEQSGSRLVKAAMKHPYRWQKDFASRAKAPIFFYGMSPTVMDTTGPPFARLLT